MPRRGRRSGVRFIEDDRDRSLTFFKRRTGLYKAAADLSTLTGARVAIVLESESGKFSSFGTPTPSHVIDAFLYGSTPTGPYASEEQKATITELQNELFQLEKNLVVEDKRKKDATALTNELQESSRIAKFAYGKVEDLDADEAREMYRELSRVHQEIQHLLSAPQQAEQHEAGGLRDPSLLQPPWWRSMPSKLPPGRVLPWMPTKPSVQMMLPTQQLPPRSLSSSMAPFQAEKMPAPQQAIPHNCHVSGMGINSNNHSNLFFQSPILPSSPPHHPSPQYNNPSSHHQQFSLPHYVEGQLPFRAQNYNSIELSRNFASSGSTSPAAPSDNPYYASLGGLNMDLGNNSENGGRTDGGHQYMFGFSGPVQGEGWIDELLSAESSSVSGAGAGNNLGGFNFPWN